MHEAMSLRMDTCTALLTLATVSKASPVDSNSKEVENEDVLRCVSKRVSTVYKHRCMKMVGVHGH